MRKKGRPPTDEYGKRERVLNVRLTEEEYTLFQSCADEQGKTMSSLVRDFINEEISLMMQVWDES